MKFSWGNASHRDCWSNLHVVHRPHVDIRTHPAPGNCVQYMKAIIKALAKPYLPNWVNYKPSWLVHMGGQTVKPTRKKSLWLHSHLQCYHLQNLWDWPRWTNGGKLGLNSAKIWASSNSSQLNQTQRLVPSSKHGSSWLVLGVPLDKGLTGTILVCDVNDEPCFSLCSH